MIDATSRYSTIPLGTLVVAGPAGPVEVRYLRRRLIPPASAHTVLAEHRCGPGERLDLLAARYLGDPTQSWRLCDASGALLPEELEVVGRVVRIGLAVAG